MSFRVDGVEIIEIAMESKTGFSGDGLRVSYSIVPDFDAGQVDNENFFRGIARRRHSMRHPEIGFFCRTALTIPSGRVTRALVMITCSQAGLYES